MKGFFIDVQGTLIDDKEYKPIDGAIEFLEFLNEKKIPFALLTNNTKREDFKEYLKSLGFKFKYYLDPLMLLDEVIKEPIAPFGSSKFLEIMKKYKIDYSNPKQVVIGLKIYSPDEIAEIIELLLKENELIGMHKTSLYHKNSKRYPGLGAILEMLKYATDKDAKVLGKPSKEFFNRASEMIGVGFDKITIISDDLKGDLLPAKELGMKTYLVLSGKVKSQKEIIKRPDKVYKSVKEILEEMKKNG